MNIGKDEGERKGRGWNRRRRRGRTELKKRRV